MSSKNLLVELFVEELRDLYSAEAQLLKAMPKMVKKAQHPELKKAIETHTNQLVLADVEQALAGL